MGNRAMIVFDTHAWLWWVSKPSDLSRAARQRIVAETRIGVSAISCLEVATAVAKGRISWTEILYHGWSRLWPYQKWSFLPLTPAIAVKATQFDNDFPGDPADRIIAATSILESAALITTDSRIRN